MRKTGEQTDRLISENITQSKSMQQSVGEAARLASAMEVVSKEIAISSKAAMDSVAALKDRTARQMRAYLQVTMNGATYQERAKNLRFAVNPVIANIGHTPANSVRHKCKAAILPFPFTADDFDFSIGGNWTGGTSMAPNQTAIFHAIVEDFCDDAEVEEIKKGTGKRGLFVWGNFEYTDIFEEIRTTTFCHQMYWEEVGDGKSQILGWFIPKYNEMK